MDKDMPPEKRQMMTLGLGGLTVVAVGFLVWMIAGAFQRDQLVQNALPSKPIPGFGGQSTTPGNSAPQGANSGGLPGAPPGANSNGLPGAPPAGGGLPGAPSMPAGR